jgi:hypothetical protein
MERTMYYRTKWGSDRSRFICELSGKLHLPVVEVRVETPAGSKQIPYKDIDRGGRYRFLLRPGGQRENHRYHER